MSSVKPLHTSHAINEVAFALQFGAELPEDVLERLQALKEPLKTDLPVVEPKTAFGIQIKSEGVSNLGQRLAGLRFSHHTTDGNVDWTLRVEQTFVAVSCLAYTRWSEVWPKARRFLQLVAPKVVSAATPLTAFALQYVDRFLYLGQPASYAVSDIFDPASVYLPRHSLDVGALWHVHQGWFQNATNPPESRILNKLNINSIASDGEYQVTVDHQQTWQLSPITSMESDLLNSDNMNQLMHRMHEDNLSLLRVLLNEAMRKKIRLT